MTEDRFADISRNAKRLRRVFVTITVLTAFLLIYLFGFGPAMALSMDVSHGASPLVQFIAYDLYWPVHKLSVLCPDFGHLMARYVSVWIVVLGVELPM